MDKDQKEKWSSMDIITDYLGVSRETVLQRITIAICQRTKSGGCGSLRFPRLMNGYDRGRWLIKKKLKAKTKSNE